MKLSIFSEAMAQTASGPAQPSTFEAMVLPILFIFFVMYFLMIRPQSKKMREHQNMMKNLKVGDEVVTSGGLIGKVRSMADAFVTLEFSPNNSAKVLRSNITSLTKDLSKKETAAVAVDANKKKSTAKA